MSAPADRPLSLARLRALPVGARIRDRDGRVWRREARISTGRPDWFREIEWGFTASYTTLHGQNRPLYLVDAPAAAALASPEPSGDGD